MLQIAFPRHNEAKACVLAMPEPNDQTWKAIASTAYNAYGSVVGFKNYQGNPMPSFDEQPDLIKQAWERVARTVGECLEHPELITQTSAQAGQQIIDEAMRKVEEGDRP